MGFLHCAHGSPFFRFAEDEKIRGLLDKEEEILIDCAVIQKGNRLIRNTLIFGN